MSDAPVDEPFDADFDLELALLLEAVYRKYQHDFRHYSVASLRRRIRQSMVQFDCRSVSQLQDRMLREPAVFARLLQNLTVQLSEMFRDPAYFKALRERVCPLLRTYPSVKCWVAGCSSGEEAWSLAILLAEEDLLERALIYATDINPEALRAAEAGLYSLERVSRFSENYRLAGGKRSLADYYNAGYDHVILDRGLRRHMVFADHSLATDTVFSEAHLISCRNVLIYFNKQLQDRAIGLFRDALVPRGFLGLGSKESLRFSAHQADFEPFVAQERIYQRGPGR